jgi:hypothetical protein
MLCWLALHATHPSSNDAPLPVKWFAPFLAGGGYSSEAIAYALELESPDFAIVQFAEPADHGFARGVPRKAMEILDKQMTRARSFNRPSIQICHATPDAWVPSMFPGWDAIAPCPHPSEAAYAIGRTMYETDRVPASWVERCNRMDEIWVPTAFHVEAFEKSGVDRSKLVVMPEAVDTVFFDPSKAEAMHLDGIKEGSFVFLSVFKWERRKGWELLLQAYFEEFTDADPVRLTCCNCHRVCNCRRTSKKMEFCLHQNDEP